MMSTAPPPFTLNREQTRRLQGYLQIYRCYALASVPPSPERNLTLRTLQTMQGKLIALLDQSTALLACQFTAEEMTTLKTITEELRLLYYQEPASVERNAIMTDLAGLKRMLAGNEGEGEDACSTSS